jgi:uncharacterized membrane protein
METIQKSIDVDLPIATVYSDWTHFEEFPKFMEGVKEVRQLSAERLYWRAEIFGKEKEWEAEVYERIPNQRIAWRSAAGTPNTGAVNFEELGNSRTRINLSLGFEPESTLEKLGDALGIVSSKIQGDLERFKRYAEERGTEVGTGRGETEPGRVRTY